MPVLKYLLNKFAGPHDLLKTDSTQFFSGEIYKMFKNTQVLTSESLRNVFTEQMFTLQLSKILPREILRKNLPSSYREKMCWERGWKLKSCLHVTYFHVYFFNFSIRLDASII